MTTPQKRFVNALKLLQELQKKGVVGIHTDDIANRKYRELLIKNGFIKVVSKGWYIASNPEEKDGEITTWYSSYWDFIAVFLEKKYGSNWCLSSNQSLLLHAGNYAVPQQLMVRSPQGNNNPTVLPHNTSVFNLRGNLPSEEQLLITTNGIRMYNLQAALIYSSATIYTQNAIDVRTVLSLIRDASELLPTLLANGHTKFAARLAGAFRNIGREKIANQIVDTFKQADYDIREEDPFESKLALQLPRERSPYANRIRLMWQQLRETVCNNFPKAPGLPTDKEAFMKDVDDIYVIDAYHSLSIECYRVSPELIAKVSSGEWNAKENRKNRKLRDAMAARGYYQAFQAVKASIKAILEGKNPGTQIDLDHSKWYRQLFDPSVVAGILKATDLAGYRGHQVYIGNSKHVPLNVDAMRDAMPVFFELLEKETEPSVRAILGHFIFVFIHPYMDGNGRMGRFIMNAMLASGGYSWTIIPVEKRDEYMEVLEQASVEQNIIPFTRFLGNIVSHGMDGQAIAALPKA